MLGAGEHYLLEIEGDSMIEAGILNGDMVIIKSTADASSGEIVVALVEGEQATLKRLRKKGASIALEPANRNYETKIYVGSIRSRFRASWSALSAAITEVGIGLPRPRPLAPDVRRPHRLPARADTPKLDRAATRA